MTRSNLGYLLSTLILRDFKVRYRNMSLGIFWSLLNPLVMMAVLSFIFTRIYASESGRNYHLTVLTGLVAYSFFSLGWSSGTVSILANASLIKRVPVPREIIPLATVLANGMHFLIQVLLMLVLVLQAGIPANGMWVWLPVVLVLEAVFICGLSLAASALDVYFRDVRYIVESTNLVMFWLVPIFYSFAVIPEQYHLVYQYNPVAAVVILLRKILLEATIELRTIVNLAILSAGVFAAGLWIFRRMKPRFADYL